MKFRVMPFFFAIILFSAECYGVAGQKSAKIDVQVVAVFANKTRSSYFKPWRSPTFPTVRGSGFFFREEKSFPGLKGLILTNAHVVSMAPSIKVSNGREKRRYSVRCLGACDAADFAVLQMEPGDLETYERLNGPIVPLELGDSDNLRVGDKVVGWGYPLGGERISKSEEGEINRIEVGRYAYSQENWLMVQASLQQNPGNSGGPVFKEGKVVGIAFQGIRASDRINYFIPISLVRRLLPLLEKQDLIPRWRGLVQLMFPQLKEYYGLRPDQGGVLLNYVIPHGGPFKFGLRNDDILLGIDGEDIDNFGDIFFTPLGQKIHFEEVLNRKKVGDSLTMRVIRDGEVLNLEGRVAAGLPMLVPKVFSGANYFIMGGIGFVELTVNCINELGKAGRVLRNRYVDEFPERALQKIVIISELFPEYGLVKTEPYLKKRVEKINGEDVLNLEGLFTAVETLKNRGVKKAMLGLSKNVQLPLDLEHVDQLDKEIQSKYGILYMKTLGGFL